MNGTNNDIPVYVVVSGLLLTEYNAMKIFTKLQGNKISNKFGSTSPSKRLTSATPNKLDVFYFKILT